MAKVQENISILSLYCPNPILLLYAFLTSEQKIIGGFVLPLYSITFF